MARDNRPSAENASTDQGPVPVQSSSNESLTNLAPRFPTRQLLWWSGIIVALTAVAQTIVSTVDHQLANIITAVLLGVLVVAVGLILQRYGKAVGHVWRVPALAALSVLVLAAVLEFDGFSGEMVPQFHFRFARPSVALSTSQVKRTELSDVDLALPEATAAIDSPQFLGPNRNGTFVKRFATPTSPSEVKVVWQVPIGEGWSSFAVMHDRAVTLEQRGQEECLTCYRLADGELLWIRSHAARHEHPLGGVGPRSTPTIHDGRVYALGATGKLWCVDLETGDELWSQDLLTLAGWDQTASEQMAPWGRSASPLVFEGQCIVPLGAPADPLPEGIQGRSLISLNTAYGDIIWTAGEDQISYASPTTMTIDGQTQIVSVNEKSITGHRIDNGETLWSFPWPGQTNGGANCSMIVPAGENQFIIGKGYGGGSALVSVTKDDSGKLTAEAVWSSSRSLKTKFTHAIVDGEDVFALSDGILQAVSLEDAKILWQQPRISRSGQGQAILAEDVLVIQTEPGPVVIAAAESSAYQELCILPGLGDRTWNIPTLAGRHLLVRNDHEAICYLLPELNESDRPEEPQRDTL